MSRKPETVRARIEDMRKRTAPPENRQSRQGYASKEDFAVIVGVSRSRMFAWTRENDPEYPDERSCELLAAVSDGRYQPSDFLPSGEESTLATRLARLEAEAVRTGDLESLLRVVELLVAGKRAEAQRAWLEAGLTAE